MLKALPPLPSVITELDLGSPHFRLRRSCVAALLAELLAGFASDASLDEVVQRVSDCGKTQELIDCSFMDGDGLFAVLRDDYNHPRHPPDRPGPFDDDSILPKSLCEFYLPEMRAALDATDTHCTTKLVELASVAVYDGDVWSFRAIIDRLRQLAIKVDASSVLQAVGECVEARTLCQHDAPDDYIDPLIHVANWSASFVKHFPRVFEMVLFALLEADTPTTSAEFLRAHPDVAPQALATEWRCEPHPYSSQLARCSLQYIRSVANWELIGEFLANATKLIEDAETPGGRLGAFIDNVSRLAKGFPPPVWPAIHANVNKAERLGWHIASVMWRARRKRLTELCFLEWLEASDFDKPRIENGYWVYPKRMREEFERDTYATQI